MSRFFEKIKSLSDRQTGLSLLFFLVLFEALAAAFALHRPPWGDEVHFYQTVVQFGRDMGLQTIKHYNEMSAPLPFMLYAWWGRLFGFELWILRLLSIVIALATYMGFYFLLLRMRASTLLSLLATLFLALHPYMVGLSLFVFTDMLPILASVLALLFLLTKRYVLLSLAAMAGILSRQYFIFFTGAVILFSVLAMLRGRDRACGKTLAASVISLIPIALLVLYWQGPSPQNEINYLYLNETFRFHGGYFNLYVILAFVYLLPFVVWRAKNFLREKWIWGAALPLSFLYFLAPVEACPAARRINLDTVGYFHKFLRMTIGAAWEDAVFYLAYLAGWVVLMYLGRLTVQRLVQRKHDLLLLISLIIISFYLIMPLSYLLWEKYFIPLVPVFICFFILDWISEKNFTANTGR